MRTIKCLTPLVHDRYANHLTCLLVFNLYDVRSVAYMRNMLVILIDIYRNVFHLLIYLVSIHYDWQSKRTWCRGIATHY